MRNTVFGLIIGIVAGIVLGATVIAPRMSVDGTNVLRLPATAPASSDTNEPDAVSTIAPETPQAIRRYQMASAYPADLPAYGSAAKRMEREVWRASDGRTDLRFHPPGALVKNDDAVDAVASGAIDAHFTDLNVLAETQPALTLFAGPPFGASVAAYLGWVSGPGAPLFEEIMADMGLVGVVCGMVPHVGGGWFKEPVRTVNDIAQLRVRAIGAEADMFRRLGADTVDLPIADTLIALQSGTLNAAQLSAPHVDAVLSPIASGSTYYVPGWRTPARVFVLIFGTDTWSAMPSGDKALIGSVCGDNVRHAIAEGEALQFEALKKISEAGADVQPWPAEIRDAMQNAWAEEAAARQKDEALYSRVLRSYRQYIKGQSIWEELARP